MPELIATIGFIAIWVILTTIAFAISHKLAMRYAGIWKKLHTSDAFGTIVIIVAILVTVAIWTWLNCSFFAWELTHSQRMTCLSFGLWP